MPMAETPPAAAEMRSAGIPIVSVTWASAIGSELPARVTVPLMTVRVVVAGGCAACIVNMVRSVSSVFMTRVCRRPAKAQIDFRRTAKISDERQPIISSMKPRITLLTLGVDELERSLAFYRDGLGLPTNG